MIRYRLGELIADKQFREGRHIPILEIAAESGVSRMILSRMINKRGYSTVTDNLDLLCRYFGCRLDQLIEYVADPEIKNETRHATKQIKMSAIKSATIPIAKKRK